MKHPSEWDDEGLIVMLEAHHQFCYYSKLILENCLKFEMHLELDRWVHCNWDSSKLEVEVLKVRMGLNLLGKQRRLLFSFHLNPVDPRLRVTKEEDWLKSKAMEFGLSEDKSV